MKVSERLQFSKQRPNAPYKPARRRSLKSPPFSTGGKEPVWSRGCHVE